MSHATKLTITDESGESQGRDFDCGAMSGLDHKLVGCENAGTEECDFECPFRKTVERSLRVCRVCKYRRLDSARCPRGYELRTAAQGAGSTEPAPPKARGQEKRS